ncbi:TetR/AcrR family transcriptional regulator [Sulfurimonas indica]|uniref:TetR/AcrR family transcriptional regulator n=1 Tax=Sulfurimonas indica TaxID=2508707 RepID=UPI001264D8FF|nr:TetR/AcrR family transcriptional regulator [Sulfurimonas indica]
MAIIVNKEQKKRDIALACKDLILTNGINNITVSQVAKTAGIGKGTVYEYFANKDEIVFELVNILMLQHSQKLQKTLQTKESTKEKIREFSRFFYSDEEQELRKLYREFISLSLVAPKSEMVEFHAKCTESYFVWFCEILQNGIEKDELNKEALLLAKGLFAIGDGIFVQNSVIGKESDIQNDLDSFIDTLFDLMERK